MATRLRFSESVTAARSPAVQAYTHNNAVRRKLARSDSSALTTTAYTPDAADDLVAGDAMHTQFVSDPMAAGNVFTTGDVLKYAIQVLEANAANNLVVQIFVSIVSEDGATVRATIRSKNSGGTEMGTTIANRFRSTTLSATYTTVAGDRLVVELSATGTPTAAGGVQGHNWSLRRGANGAGGDLAENETDTGATLNPWIEFATTIVWNDVTVTPGKAALTTATFAPTVTAGAGTVVTPGKAALVTSSFAPTVRLPKLVTPGVAALALTRFAPSVLTPRLVTPGVRALSLATFAPVVAVGGNRVVVPGVAALALTRFAPVVLTPRMVVPGARALALTRFAPVVLTPRVVVPGVGALTVTRFAPSVVMPKLATPATRALALTRFAPTVLLPRRVTPATAALVLTTYPPLVTFTAPYAPLHAGIRATVRDGGMAGVIHGPRGGVFQDGLHGTIRKVGPTT